jgi:hypothetical protein
MLPSSIELLVFDRPALVPKSSQNNSTHNGEKLNDAQMHEGN